MPPTSPAVFFTPPLCYSLAHRPTSSANNKHAQHIMICPCCVQQNTPNVFFYICLLISTKNGCLRELNAAIPETDLVIVINERTLNNTVNA